MSHFGELRGHPRAEAAGRAASCCPTWSAKAERFEDEAGNPFRDGGAAGTSVGVDGKLGLTTNLTADFTFNPDFGQVEADPSEVNLTAFETFFEEKRPFFIEGADIFEVRLANVDPGQPLHPRPAVLLPPHRRPAPALARARRRRIRRGARSRARSWAR